MLRSLRMSKRGLAAATRTQAIARHMSTKAGAEPFVEPTVNFETRRTTRTYTLNRPAKLNALDEPMLNTLRPKIEEWAKGSLAYTFIGLGAGRAFCAGGDVAGVVKAAQAKGTRPNAIEFFKREFEMDYMLARHPKTYVAIMDGITMGGGVGLAAHAPFRVATENTLFAMPETKIGYSPDVGASHFLNQLDGELGTYLALTSETLKGRAVYELGFATHYIPSIRVNSLIDRLAEIEEIEQGPYPQSINTIELVDRSITELHYERQADEPPTPLRGDVRKALDQSFRHNRVEDIVASLEELKSHSSKDVKEWATKTLETLRLRSPTSLKIALKALRRGTELSLLRVLQMELGIAIAYCNGASRDFKTGVEAVIVNKSKDRPKWSPSTIEEVDDYDINENFFSVESPFIQDPPSLDVPEFTQLEGTKDRDIMKWALPTQEEIKALVVGLHATSGETGMRVEEVVSQLEAMYPGKPDLKEKVLDTLARKCELVDNADGMFQWLKWKHRATQ